MVFSAPCAFSFHIVSINLYEHNQQAYEAAIDMLADTGRAAIIHPTGTGKSFIAFKLCEDHPEASVCWLSPSDYIFKTQCENLGEDVPTNIRFLTYARLMLMTAGEIAALQPDYIILDEFHRCGAEMWGQGVERLLAAFPHVPLLGLSATAIRYLDSQRNMAEELFDNNIASEIGLSEAILRGILNPPKYVLSVFPYKKMLAKYEARVQAARAVAVRNESEKYLEALRRALEQADGLDVIFDRHMTDRHGKYLVFCANLAHMKEMVQKAPRWFAKVDPAPHVYTAYSNDPETSRAFADFKADRSEHLKLLYCIDMLNEGIHVADVSGVILLRPTVSPIIYKQQIGRTLSANKAGTPVIFDVVLNIENLASIGTIQQEMNVLMTYYRDHGMSSRIVNESFEVVDEVRDCITLFNRLNEFLSATWDTMYRYAEEYYKTHGDLNVPAVYKTPDGYNLGQWLGTQRRIMQGVRQGILTDEQIAKLNALGFDWRSRRETSWEKYYRAAQVYFAEHGDLLIPKQYETPEGLKLGTWIQNVRACRKSHIRSSMTLTPEHIAQLDAIGMVWEVPDYVWSQNYNAAVQYHRAHGDLNVPTTFVTEEGIRLGAWIYRLRKWRNDPDAESEGLTDEQIRLLDDLDMIWHSRNDAMWEQNFAAAQRYYKAHGHLNVPAAYVAPDGTQLGTWIRRQRASRQKLSPDRKRRLDALGMKWRDTDPWDEKMRLVEAYYAENGHANIPFTTVVNGVWLGHWLKRQVDQMNGASPSKKQLTQEQITRLVAVGARYSIT